jgi:hypothetical protein
MTETVTLDLDSLTLGEMSAVEVAAGQDFIQLLSAGRATQRLIGLYVNELRHSDKPRSWRELSALRSQDAPSSTLRVLPAGSPASVPA